jgi:membrane protein YqaA with SNARE-associated domain
MDPSTWFGPNRLYAATFVVSFVSGVFPLVNTEAYLLTLSSLSSTPALPVVLISTIGQMISKLLLYLAGRGLLKFPLGTAQSRLKKLREQLERRRGKTGALIFLSAFLGFPPFYEVTVLAGVVQVPLWDFLLPSLAGRFLRFGVIFAFPQLILSSLA